MAVTEITVNPLYTLSSSSGFSGTRQWVVDACDDLDMFLRVIGISTWPNKPNVLPVQITVGPYLQDPVIRESALLPRNLETPTLGYLPTFNAYLVTCQYQYFHVNNCWPDSLPKPPHLLGTVMSIRVRGSGQFLLASPNGFHMMGQALGPNVAMTHSDNCRFILPITEYHVTIERLTRAHFNRINPSVRVDDSGSSYEGAIPWSQRIGTVNSDIFLGQPAGVLLFDNWEMDETFAPDVDDPVRYRLTAIIRQRKVLDANGTPLTVPPPGSASGVGEIVGWNHDFKVQGASSGWVKYGLRTNLNTNDTDLKPRYSSLPFNSIFCDQASVCLSGGECSETDPSSSVSESE